MDGSTAYCMRCKERNTIIDPVKKKQGRVTFIKGTCAKCGTKVSTIAKRK